MKNYTPPDFENIPPPDPEEMKRKDEAREKKISRDIANRLNHVQRYLTEELEDISPGASEKYEFKKVPMTEYGGRGETPYSSKGSVRRLDLPAYEVVLARKDDSEGETYTLLHLLRPDLLKKMKVKDIPHNYQLPGFAKEKIPKGLQKLRRGKKGGLENISDITPIILIIGSFFFLSTSFTGYAIVNSSSGYSHLIGIALFMIGLIMTFFMLKKNKQN